MARRRVLVVGFAVHRAQATFAALARRVEARPGLAARLCPNIGRTRGDATRAEAVVARLTQHFGSNEWPGRKLPGVLSDPQSLALAAADRASLHAKVITIDGEVALVTSANPTTAA